MNYAFWFRLIVSILVTALLLRAIEWDDFPGLNDVKVGYFCIAGMLVLLNRFINAFRWHTLINQASSTLSFRHVLGIYFKSSFVGLVMPSSVGGEFLKGYGLMKSGSGAIDSFSSIFMERLLGLISLLGTALIGFLFLNIQLDEIHSVAISRVFMTVFALIVGGLMGCYFAIPWIEQRLKPHSKVTVLVERLRQSFFFYQGIKVRLFLAFLLSFIIQLVRVYGAWFVGLGLGITVELAYYILFIPVITLIAMMPVSIAGLGVQEGAFVYFFSLAGTNPTIILTMALILRLLLILAVLPGGYLYLRDGLGYNIQQGEALKP